MRGFETVAAVFANWRPCKPDKWEQDEKGFDGQVLGESVTWERLGFFCGKRLWGFWELWVWFWMYMPYQN